LAASVALALTGCSRYKQFHYNGLIGEEKVHFWERDNIFETSNYLEVEKKDGRKILYKDMCKDDLKIESVDITKEGIKETYWLSKPIGDPIVKKAQKQFDDYLQKIFQINKKKAEELIKK